MKLVPVITTAVIFLVALILVIQQHWAGLAVFLTAVILLLVLFCRTLARFALDRKARLNLVQYFDYETEHGFPVFRKAAADWNRDREEWELTSRDGLRLKAGFHPQSSHDYVILCHGYGNDDLDGMCVYARPYLEAGWNVLTPYARAHGPSEGRYIGMGWRERLDIADWMAKIRLRDPEARIVLHGVSMGGATVLNAAGENPEGLEAVVADCGYTSVWDQFAAQAQALFGLPSFPVLNIADRIARPWLGAGFHEADTTAQVARIQVPVLFIHGQKDTFVPFPMMEKNWNACSAPKEKIIVPTAGHANSIYEDPDYGKKVLAFLDRVRSDKKQDSL